MVKYFVEIKTEDGNIKKTHIQMPKEFSIRKHLKGFDEKYDNELWRKIQEKISFRGEKNTGYTLTKLKKVI